MIDSILVNRKMSLIIQDLEALKEFAAMEYNVYMSDPINQAASERYLERIINRMIDINYHVSTAKGKAPPKDYYQSFIELGQLQILPTDFSTIIAQSAGLRNRISHDYDDLDPRLFHEAMKSAIVDIPKYLKFVSDSLEA
ncbi:MAG: DUF86 domain-containing protein [Gammaproteobacteria bacterium]|nr:DUF86 domain-containing protein [Gammaproteobacteria bacterium]MDH5693336.1 DUF86 domain-containing protein [Gammaproteobacteria bacterium]